MEYLFYLKDYIGLAQMNKEWIKLKSKTKGWKRHRYEFELIDEPNLVDL